MRNLMSTTILTPIAFALLPTAAIAQSSISTAITTPVRTSTANNGSPSDVTVTSTGSITLAGGSAITIDSNNAATNGGTITLGAADGATGIDALSGTSSIITNSGTIAITENFTAINTDANAVSDGPIAQANDRAGIRVRGGGTHVGNIVQSGTINVEGLNSAGVRVDDALTGSVVHSGTIKVRGDGSVGLQTGAVSGNVVLGGAIQVVGKGASAVNITGDVGGTIRFENLITQQLTYLEDNGVTMSLPRSDMIVGAPTVAIAGNVGGGIIVAAAPTISTTVPDNDGDGIADSLETAGGLQSYGNGAALRIGGATNTVIAPVASNGHGVVIAGSVVSAASFNSTNSVALQIGGMGGAVNVNGGISVTGKVQATTNDATATAILINAGSTVPVIDNSGTIGAAINVTGQQGASYGIRDLSGTLTTINNTGFITAAGTVQDTTSAIDVSAATGNVTITQAAPASTAAGTSTISPVLAQITGNILTGSGNDQLIVNGGVIKGNALLGAGNDSVTLAGDSVFQGNVDFGTGAATMALGGTSQYFGTAIFNGQPATLTLAGTAAFTGQISGGSNLAVAVNGGTLGASGTNDLSFKSLNVASGGTIKVAIDTVNKTNPKFVVDTATFASGSHVAATVSSLTNAEGNYVILTANQITGTPDFGSTQTSLPFLFKGTVSVDTTAKQLSLNIARKSATELGLNRVEAAAYPAIFAAAPIDTQLQQSLLGAADSATVKSQFDQLLPDHAGGNFDMLTRGSRMARRHITDNNSMYDISDVGGWLEALKWGGNKDAGQTAGYKTNGFGVSGGLERRTGIGNVGVSLAWFNGKNENPDNLNEVKINDYEVGAFWRVSKGPFYAFARGAVSFASFTGSRTYSGTDSAAAAFARVAAGKWKGTMYSGAAGASYQVDVGDTISFKPMAIIDYYRLHEKGYTETGGAQSSTADAVDLVVAPRTSESTTATTTLTGIYRFGKRTNEGIPLTIELEGGRRNMLSGSLGNTTANFVGGSSFTLVPDKLPSAWVGEARLLSGGLDYTWTLAAGAEQTEGKPAYTFRVSLSAAF